MARFAVIRADRQITDRQLGRVIASGNVLVELQGWRLWADRLEYADADRSVRATGQVRLQKGDQYLQASSLRYSDWEGSGELLDVYGVIDRDTLPAALQATPETNRSAPVRPAADPEFTFACPPLAARGDQRPTVHVLPLGRLPLPTIPAPPGCPGAVEAGPQAPGLEQTLTETVLGPGLKPGTVAPIPPLPAQASEERVRNVQFQQSLDTAIKLDLSAVIDSADTADNNPAGGRYRPAQGPKGAISRIRFQASRLSMQGDRWTAPEVAFTNDPFTPANSWTIARQVTAVLERSTGITRIQARSSRILLDQRLSVPGITNTTIGGEESRLVIDIDRKDRDGVYLGYNLPPIAIGQTGRLQLQPQLMLQRLIEGKSDSFIEPGAGLGSSTVEQAFKAGDAFGLEALLNLPVAGMQLNADLSLASFDPDHFASGTRSIATLSRPLGLSWAPSATASLFGGYRERIYNGSLGLQNLIWSYGARLSGSHSIDLSPQRLSPTPGSPGSPRGPYFKPLNLSWGVQTGNYQAQLFNSEQLATLWRTNLNVRAGTSLRIWEGRQAYNGRGQQGLRYGPIPVQPGLGLDLGLAGTLNYYGDGTEQNTVSLWGGPSLTLGQFEKPWLDYTRLAVAISGTLRSGLSPFGFDRAVDLRTLSFNASQQIYGPLVLEGGATFNIDPDSEYYGEASFSYIEVKLQRRSYEIGVYYSPYDGIGGIRLRLNDFNFTGPGTPFVPRPAETREAVTPNRRPGSS